MKLALLGVGLAVVSGTVAGLTGFAQSPPATVKVLGCLQGEGSDQKPWMLSGVALPAAPTPGAPGGGGGRGGGRGGGAAAAAPAPAALAPLVDLRLTGGLNMSPWRGMKIEVEGT